MDSQYFIYWDDIDWCHRFKKMGYKVAVTSASKVWHKMGAANQQTTFPTYYFWRNRIHFFAKETTGPQLQKFVDVLCEDLFQAIFFSQLKLQSSVAETLMHAVHDAVHGLRGRAGQGRIRARENLNTRWNILSDLLRNKMPILTDGNDLFAFREVAASVAAKTSGPIGIRPKTHDLNTLKEKLAPLNLDVNTEFHDSDAAQVVIQACDHVLNIRDELSLMPETVFIDRYGNMVLSQQDRLAVQGYDWIFAQTKQWLYPYLLQKITDLRNLQEE
jgi:hypothetical protein